MSKKIAVIGSNSFSGSDFIDLLLEKGGFEIVGISRSREKNKIFLPYKRHKNTTFSFFRLDLNKDMKGILNLLDKFKPHFIVNFAAQSEVAPSWEYPEHWFETNTVSLSKLVNHLRKTSYLKRYIHISSPEVYGTCWGRVKEDAPLAPSTPYAASKASADLFLQTLFKNFHFPVIFIRSTNVYGAHQQLFKIIPRTVISINLRKIINLHGGGKAVKSYIHISDVSKGELAVLEKGRLGQIYHLSPDQGIEVKDVVSKICQKMKVDFKKVTRAVSERAGQDKAYVIDSSKARREFGWKPKKNFSEGIDEVINWIKDNWDEIRKMPLEYTHKP